MNPIENQIITNPHVLEVKNVSNEMWFIILNYIYDINKDHHYGSDRKQKYIFFFSQASKAAYSITKLFIKTSPSYLNSVEWRSFQYNQEKTRSDTSINFFRKNGDGSFYCSNSHLPKLMKFLPHGDSANLQDWQRTTLICNEGSAFGSGPTGYDRIEDFLTFGEKYLVIASRDDTKHIIIIRGEEEYVSYEVGGFIFYASLGNTFYFWNGGDEFSEIDMRKDLNEEPLEIKYSAVWNNYINNLHKKINYKFFVHNSQWDQKLIQFFHFSQHDGHQFIIKDLNVYEAEAFGDIIRTYQNPSIASCINVSPNWLVAQNNSTFKQGYSIFNIFSREEAGKNLSPRFSISLPKVLKWFLDEDFLIVVSVDSVMTYDLRRQLSHKTITRYDNETTIEGAWTTSSSGENKLFNLVSKKIEGKRVWGQHTETEYKLSIHQEPLDTRTWQPLQKNKAQKSVKIQPKPIPHSKDFSIKSLSEGKSNCTTPKIIAVASLIFSIISLTAFFTITFNHQAASWLDNRWISAQNIAYIILSAGTIPSIISSGIAFYHHKKLTLEQPIY